MVAKLSTAEFEKTFLHIFSVDRKTCVTLSDTPENLDLDSLDMFELFIDLEDAFDLEMDAQSVAPSDYVRKPLKDFYDTIFKLYYA